MFVAIRILLPLFDDLNVYVAHLLMGPVALAIAFERQIGEEPVERREAAVEVRIELGDGSVKIFPDLFALEGARRR